MCGIAGIISPDPAQVDPIALQSMAASMAHRGPDAESTWTNPTSVAGFAHRRLCIIDRTDGGAQPMHYRGRYTMVYNGEVYNYIELRQILASRGHRFHSQSDSEVLLAAFAEFGEACLDHIDGMFSFAIWDEQRQELFCARDRFGERPFFYHHDRQCRSFAFGSELKALYAAGVPRQVNHPMWLLFLAFGYTTDPNDAAATFDANIKKLPAAHWLRFSAPDGVVTIRRYWAPRQPVAIPSTENDTIEQFGQLLQTSVVRRLRADVQVGASLSGGLDSSSILSLCAARLGQQGSLEQFTSFTAAFPGFAKNESARAQRLSARFGVQHYAVEPDAYQLVQDLDKVIYYQEEPFGSASVFAQYKVFEAAKQHGVTVLLDGQGADETLAGYSKYRDWWKRTLLPAFTAGVLRQRDIRRVRGHPDICASYIDAWFRPSSIVKPEVRSLDDMLHFDTTVSGLEELLRYADRNAMAHGREVRLPFLYHELVEFLFALPRRYKLRDGYTKWILRKKMEGVLPAEIAWSRDKTGFEPPQKAWMENTVVREYIHEAKKKLVDEKILNATVLSKGVAHEAYTRASEEWRYFVAGRLMGLPVD